MLSGGRASHGERRCEGQEKAGQAHDGRVAAEGQIAGGEREDPHRERGQRRQTGQAGRRRSEDETGDVRCNAHDVFCNANDVRSAGHRSRISDGPGQRAQDREEGRFGDEHRQDAGQAPGAGVGGERAGPAVAAGRDPGRDDAGQPDEKERSGEARFEKARFDEEDPGELERELGPEDVVDEKTCGQDGGQDAQGQPGPDPEMEEDEGALGFHGRAHYTRITPARAERYAGTCRSPTRFV